MINILINIIIILIIIGVVILVRLDYRCGPRRCNIINSINCQTQK